MKRNKITKRLLAVILCAVVTVFLGLLFTVKHFYPPALMPYSERIECLEKDSRWIRFMKSWKGLDFKGLTPEKQDPLFKECAESARNLEGLVKERMLSKSEYEMILIVITPYVTTYAYQTGGSMPSPPTSGEIIKIKIESAKFWISRLNDNMCFYRSIAQQDACIEFVFSKFLGPFGEFYLTELKSLDEENFKYWDNDAEKQKMDAIVKEASDLYSIISDRYFSQPENMKK